VVLALVAITAIASSVMPASAGRGQKYLKKSVYGNGEGIFAASHESAQDPKSIGPMGSGPIDPSELDTIASLPLPAGHFAIFAKAWIQRQGTDVQHVHCALVAESQTDHARTQTGEFDASIALELAHTLSEPYTVTLECADDADGRATLEETKVQHARIIAIRAPSLR
jgi:hypothetical protein